MDCCNHKVTIRDEEEKKNLLNRISRINGQINGVKNMIIDNRYCEDVLIQLSAIEKAIKSLESVILERHLKTCVVKAIEDGNSDIINEVVDLFKRL